MVGGVEHNKQNVSKLELISDKLKPFEALYERADKQPHFDKEHSDVVGKINIRLDDLRTSTIRLDLIVQHLNQIV